MSHEIQSFGNLIKGYKTKQTNGFASKQKVIKNQIITAENEAKRILRDAEDIAEKILREAHEESKNLRADAYSEGTENALTEFEQNLIESHEIRERIWRETEKDLLRLAVRLAEKIVGREIKKDDKTIVNIVSAALQNARQQEKLTVRVNPKELSLVEKESENFATDGRIQFIDFVADPRVMTTGCLIESEVGTIDARLETQLRVLERALLSQTEGETSLD